MPARNAQPRHLDPKPPRSRRKRSRAPLVVLLVLLLVAGGAGVGVYLYLNPPRYDITVNGAVHTVDRGATIATVLEEGYVAPRSGNLLAIDGSVLEEGGGDAFAATVNGAEVSDPATVLDKGAVVEIADGADVTEPEAVAEEVIPYGQSSTSMDLSSYYDGSLHVYSQGEDGILTTRTGSVSGISISEGTKPAVDAGYHVYTANVGDDRVVALTFDDGPWGESTDAILDVLEQYGAKATFFTVGEQVVAYPEQVRRARELGCMVCTHTWDHAAGSGQGVNLTYMTPDEQIAEVQQGYAALADALGEEPPHVLRAPGGNYYGDLITTLAPYVDVEVGWDIDTEDWRLPGTEAIVAAAMGVQPGQVVLMHDGGGDRSQTVEAVRQVVPALIEQGYELVTVADLLAYE